MVDFDLGRLPAPVLDAVGGHLSSCQSCQQALSDLHSETGGDDLIGLLKQVLRESPPPVVEDGWTAMVALVETIAQFQAGPRTGQGDPERQGAETDRFAAGVMSGRYRLCGKLGQGGMGVVYRACQVSLDRMVALKMILAGHHADAQTIARFHVEGKAIARLRHPNVVQVYELGEFQGLPYYTMELIDGGSLRTRIAEGPLELREAAILVRTLAEAAEYAHGEGVVHRDLKPANILLARDGTPMIADFGLAKLLDVEPGGTTSPPLTDAGAILGTSHYMAPEQLGGVSAEISGLTDVYALGAILYELLTGQPPFAARTKFKTFELVRSAAPVPPSELRPEVPYWLESICLKCLEKHPARRYGSAQALADDLDRWLRDERPEGTPRWFRRAERISRRHALTLLTGSALSTAAIGWNLSDPRRHLRKIESRLASGQTVTLIGNTGKPLWSEWLTGETRSQVSLSDDGCFTITAVASCLLELLPDPGSPSYRFSADVRHEWGEAISEVGPYVARTSTPTINGKAHFFTQVGFNGVRTAEEIHARSHAAFTVPPPRTNPVELFARVLSEESVKPYVDARYSGVTGPKFRPFGSNNRQWHHLDVVVTPDRVTVTWNGQSFHLDTATLNRNVSEQLAKHPPHGANPLPRDYRPVFHPRGGLGFMVRKGTAAFRSAEVTLL